MCFPVNFAKFLRTLFSQHTSGQLLLGLIAGNFMLILENFLEQVFNRTTRCDQAYFFRFKKELINTQHVIKIKFYTKFVRVYIVSFNHQQEGKNFVSKVLFVGFAIFGSHNISRWSAGFLNGTFNLCSTKTHEQ